MGSAVKSIGNVAKKFGGVVGVTGVGGKMLTDAASKQIGKIGAPGDSGLTQSNFDVTQQAKKYEDIYNQQLADAQARSAAANSPALIAQLSRQAMGQGPSLAEAQLKSATNRNLAQQLAAAASMRGRNPAATQRQVLNMQGDAGRQLAEQSAVARLQEQQQAASQLAQQQQMADAVAQNAAQQGFQAALAPTTVRQNYDLARAGIKAQDRAADKQMLGSGLGAGATLLAALSDEKTKKNIKPGDKDVSKFLGALDAKNYEYKEPDMPGAAPGKRVGILAQDLEKSDMGKTLVKDTPAGKMIDVAQGIGAVLAAQSHLNKRMDKIEGKKMAGGGYVEQSTEQAQGLLNKLKGIDTRVNIDIKSPTKKPSAPEQAQSSDYGNAGENYHDFSNMAAKGGRIMGPELAPGDSEKNDVVHIMASGGEIIVPKSAAKSPEKAHKFIDTLFASKTPKAKNSKMGQHLAKKR